MDRINTPSATPDRKFTDGDDLAGIEGTIVSALFLTDEQETLMHPIENTGQVGVEGDPTQLTRAMQIIGTRRIVITQSQTWTVPDGVYRIAVEIVGGGGGSGGTNGPGTGSLGGGGAGWGKGTYTVVPGTNLPATIGAGGTPGVGGANPTAGGPGGTSSLGTLISATGGLGGAPSSSGFPSGVTLGGTTFGADQSIDGGTCSAPFAISNGVITSQGGIAAGGVPAHFGAAYGSALGIAGQAPGCGAAGSAAQAAGAAGAPGRIITY